MSETKHTRGPWTVGQKGEHGTFNPNHIYTSDGSSVAEVYEIPMHVRLEEIEHSGTWDEGLANARLIAAAPELLWALNQSIAHLANPQAFDSEQLGRDWMELKLKAEGSKSCQPASSKS